MKNGSWNRPADPATGRRAKITIEVEIETSKRDSVDDLAHGLSADVIKALRDTHEVSNRILAVEVDGRDIYRTAAVESGDAKETEATNAARD